MIKQIKSLYKNVLNKFTRSKVKMFTLYIPSPPKRDSIYREKNLDKIIYDYLDKGHQIVSTETIQNGSQVGGFWLILTVKTTNQSTAKIDLNFPDQDKLIAQNSFSYSSIDDKNEQLTLEVE